MSPLPCMSMESFAQAAQQELAAVNGRGAAGTPATRSAAVTGKEGDGGGSASIGSDGEPMGAVPIVLAHAGLAPLFAGEPILVVKAWTDVTPALLARWRPPPGRSRSVYTGYWHRKLEADANVLRAEMVESFAKKAT